MTSVMPPTRSSDGFIAVARSHVADNVFAQLVGAILRGERAVGSSLPPERVLAEQFGTSRVIVRQAVHRLAELGLLRVRQGGATTVLDPNDAADVRVIELYYRYGTQPTAHDVRELTERQLLGAITLVNVAARRAKVEDLGQLSTIVEQWAAAPDLERAFPEFEAQFWTTMARIGGNRIYALESAWWFRLLRERPDLMHARFAPVQIRLAFMRELVRRLVERDEPAKFAFDVVTRFLAVLDSENAPALPEVPR
jgi:GntR family transcriptional repressor for pyruvate dehydrogenase complex